MMRVDAVSVSKFLKTSVLALVIVGGIWLLVNRDQIQQPGDVVAMARQSWARVNWPQAASGDYPTMAKPFERHEGAREPFHATRRSHGSGYSSLPSASGAIPVSTSRQARRSIRIATFAIDGTSGDRRDVSKTTMLADICRRYDVIALQCIENASATGTASRMLDDLVSHMNRQQLGMNAGVLPEYQLLIGQSHARMNQGTQLAIVFDARAVQLDEGHWYTMNDPDGALGTPPIVAWFRTRGVPLDQAFTFSLVNVQLDAHRPDQELIYVSEIFRAVRDDGRHEDDVILAGNFNAGDRGLGPVQKRFGLTWVISGVPTNTRRTAQFENVVFNGGATVEYTGQFGVFDFLKHYNLRLVDALELSSHLPVWAEFSLREGDSTGIGRTARK